ncbi:nuclear pore complex protein DDB_G0274915-like [Microplitis mediator]|uniref:nuclear pore complex protein DDB_G0274915-like n=1 Tax=Microplitis mediator TaxID=375433 RepID=UPI002552AE0A|nr:nuclear pore complex protein DDB_G0274915-like [Microplitis mediator]XP_057319201.1 nuclear pore complex protein DDB_G0274915-like [Microplitis mediator]
MTLREYEDPIVTCPLDSSHRIHKSRMQTHLTKCRKNHDLTNKIICPFNPLHIINANEEEKHYTECESYGAGVGVQQFDLGDRPNFSGIISHEESVDQLSRAFAAFGCTNDNVDRFHTIDGPGYDPVQASIDKPLYRSLDCEPKSVLHQFRMAERQRHAACSAQETYEWENETEQNDDHESLEHEPMSSEGALMTHNDYQDENDENDGNIEEDRSQFDAYSSDNGLTNENKSETSKDESSKKFENESRSTGRFENLSEENNHGSLVDEMGFTLVSENKSKGAIKKKMMKNQPEVTTQNNSGLQRKGNQISKEAAKTPVNKSINQANSSFNGNTNTGLRNENKNETSNDESTKKFENESRSTGRFENLSDLNNHGSLVDEMGYTLVSRNKSKGAIKKKMMKNQPEVTTQNKSGPQRKGNQISKKAAKTPVHKPINQANSSINGNTNPSPSRSCNIIGGQGIVHAGSSNSGRSNPGPSNPGPSNSGRSNPGPSRSQNIIGGRGIVHSSQCQRPGPRDD